MATPNRPEGRKAKKGDEGELFVRYGRDLERSVRARMRVPRQVIEDACSYAWLQLVRTQPERDRIFAWLRTVAINEALAIERRRKRAAVPLDALTDERELRAEQ